MFVFQKLIRGKFSISRAVYKNSLDGRFLVIDGEINNSNFIEKGTKNQIIASL